MSDGLFARINSDLMQAMKDKNELKLSVLRMIKSKVLYINARGDLPEAEVLKIVSKYAKDIKESIEEIKKLGRADEAAKIEPELAIVQEYLPKELTSDDLKTIINDIIKTSGASGMKDMGKVMKEISAKYPTSDGKVVSQLVREALQ